VRFDASVIRGLAYYTGIVFEGFARTGELTRAICGGGRYDRLMSIYDAPDIPACGFGFGDIVVLEILKDKKLLPKFTSSIDDCVVPFSEEYRGAAIEVATKLRAIGRTVDIILDKKPLKWIYSYIDRIGARRTILIAPDEWSQGLVRTKDMTLAKDQIKEANVTVEELIRISS